jgi:hypothetical protein
MIILALKKRGGSVLTRTDLQDLLGCGELSRSPDTHIAVIRKMLGPRSIRTAHGCGWSAGLDLINCEVWGSAERPEYEI